jgi:hypothetical protein
MIINPLPNKLPSLIRDNSELNGYFESLYKSLYGIWYALNGNLNDVLISTIDISPKSVATKEIFKIPSGVSFVPLSIVVRVVDFTLGSKSTNATVSFGSNSSDYNNFIDNFNCPFVANNSFMIAKPAENAILPVQESGQSFRVNVKTASDAAIEKWKIDLFGYLF